MAGEAGQSRIKNQEWVNPIHVDSFRSSAKVSGTQLDDSPSEGYRPTRKERGMGKRGTRVLPARKSAASRNSDSLLIRSAESLGRVVGSMQRRMQGTTERMSRIAEDATDALPDMPSMRDVVGTARRLTGTSGGRKASGSRKGSSRKTSGARKRSTTRKSASARKTTRSRKAAGNRKRGGGSRKRTSTRKSSRNR